VVTVNVLVGGTGVLAPTISFWFWIVFVVLSRRIPTPLTGRMRSTRFACSGLAVSAPRSTRLIHRRGDVATAYPLDDSRRVRGLI
jgi:hypothetical protein